MGSFIVDLMRRASRLQKPGEIIKETLFVIGSGGKGSNRAVAAQKGVKNRQISRNLTGLRANLFLIIIRLYP